MSSTEFTHNEGDDYITELTHTETQTAETCGHLPYRHILLTISDDTIVNDGTDTIAISLSVVDGLEIARGTEPTDATVLDYDGDVTVTVDGIKTTKTLTNGSVEFDLTTDKQAGSEIEIVAESLADHPAESDSATVEVVQA